MIIPVLVAVLFLLCSVFLIRRSQVRGRKEELLMFKRHLARYTEQDRAG
jgi:hypothetical protein